MSTKGYFSYAGINTKQCFAIILQGRNTKCKESQKNLFYLLL